MTVQFELGTCALPRISTAATSGAAKAEAQWLTAPLRSTCTQTLNSWLHLPIFRFWLCFERSTSLFGVHLPTQGSRDKSGGYSAGGASSSHRSSPSTFLRLEVPAPVLVGSRRVALLAMPMRFRQRVWQQRTLTRSALKLISSLKICCSHPTKDLRGAGEVHVVSRASEYGKRVSGRRGERSVQWGVRGLRGKHAAPTNACTPAHRFSLRRVSSRVAGVDRTHMIPTFKYRVPGPSQTATTSAGIALPEVAVRGK